MREPQGASNVNHCKIARVLAGTESYDALDDTEQAIVREQWEERMEQLRQSLDFAADFAAAEEAYTELDDAGAVATRQPAFRVGPSGVPAEPGSRTEPLQPRTRRKREKG